MPWNSRPSRLEALSLTQKSSWDGNLKGRIRQARPVARGLASTAPIEDDDTDPFESPIKFMQDSHIVTSTATQIVTLSFIPIDNSEHLYWNGLYQPGTQWSRAADSNKVIVPSDPLLNVGDLLTVEYAYIDGNEYSPIQVPFQVVSSSGYDSGAGSGSFTSLTLPPGSQAGDTLVVTALGGYFGGGATAQITDSRFSPLWGGTFCSRPALIYTGVLGSDLSPISMNVHGTSGDPTGQFVCATATNLRSSSGSPLMVDPTRIAVGTTNSPALISAGSGSVAVVFTCAGIGGVHGVGFGSPYTWASGYGVYAGTSLGVCSSESVPAATVSNSDSWQAVTFGLAYG